MKKEIMRIGGDFDGVINDSHTTEAKYASMLCEGVAQLTGNHVVQITDLVNQTKESMLASPQDHPYKNKEGVIVGPSTADFIILNGVAVRNVIEKLRTGNLPRQFPKEEEVPAAITKIFQASYPRLGFTPREGACRFIEEMQAIGQHTIISGGDGAVINKWISDYLEMNGLKDETEVIGGAQKYGIDLTWTDVPESVELEGFPWPVQLRRVRYGGILRKLDPDVVYGDVYEADLSIADQVMGKPTVLVTTTKFTAPWEHNLYQSHQRNRFSSSSLDDVTEYLSRNVLQ